MPGRWNPASPPSRPGGYNNFVAKPIQRVNAPLAGIVAMPVVADWGPIDEVVACDSVGGYKAIFGDTVIQTQSPGYTAVYQAFKGEGVNNRGGAAEVLVLRKAGSAAAVATANLADTKEAPNANAVVIKARYKGTKGNEISVSIQANAKSPSTKYDLVVFLNGGEVERWTYTKATNSTLATVVGTASDWITVEVKKSEAPLAIVSGKSLTSGANGETLTSEDWTNALSELGTKRFSVFCPWTLVSESIQAAIRAWAVDPETGANAKGKRFEVVFGGDTDETLEEAVERSAELNDPNIVNAGAFMVEDSEILAEDGDPVALSPGLFGPRIAGVIAATGGTSAITFSRLADVTLTSGLSEDAEFVEASENGVLTLAEDSNVLAPVRIEQDVTTYLDDTEAEPKELFGKLKFVRTMQKFEMRLTEFAENEEVIGKLGVTDDTREYIVGQAKKILENEFEKPGEVKSGSNVFISQDPPPSDNDNFISTTYELSFGRDVEQMRGTVVVS